MQPPSPLRERTTVDEVENVLVYVSDSLRYDETPTSVLDLGPSGRAVAASTFTGSGYPSIVTGQYPATHGVWSLEEALPTTPHLLDAYDGTVDAETVWRNVDDDASKPPLRMCHLSSSTTLADVDAPFVHVVHDFGGHMIYGGAAERDKWASIDEQLSTLADDEARIRDLYRKGVAESVERFHAICDELRDRGLWDDTLVVFTSDHGELLGEHGGLYGHGTPMVPGVLDVPLVFTGAGLDADVGLDGPTSSGDETASPADGREREVGFGGAVSTVDVVPTVLSALGDRIPRYVEGRDLWGASVPADRVVHSQVWRTTRYRGIEYRASSAWDADGGVVEHGGNPLSRATYSAINDLVRRSHATIVRKHFPALEFVRATMHRRRTYGDPGPEVADAVVPPSTFQDDVEAPATDVAAPTTEQLRELGYLD